MPHTDVHPRLFILRWNPRISDYSIAQYKADLKGLATDRVLHWAIYDHAEADVDDLFVMMRVDDDNPGIIMAGHIISKPHEGYSWRNDGTKVHYAEFRPCELRSPGEQPILTADELYASIPEIDWLHGHSGELMPPVQADQLMTLLNSICYSEDDDSETFDPEGCNGERNRCLSGSIDTLISSIGKIISTSDLVATVTTDITSPDGENATAELSLFDSKGTDIGLRTICRDNSDGLEILSFFPNLRNLPTIRLTLTQISEFTNRFEAVLTTAASDGTSISFFDIDYPLNKDKYQIGDTYNFALGAIAYSASENDSPDFEINMDDDMPVIISSDVTIGFLQLDNAYPDNCSFMSVVDGRVRKAAFRGKEFYRLPIMIAPDSDSPIVIPLFADTSFFAQKPRKGTPLVGEAWIVGHIIG